MASLTKKQIARSVQRGTGTSYNQAYQCLETTLEIIKTTLASGEDVLISNFGKFKVRVHIWGDPETKQKYLRLKSTL